MTTPATATHEASIHEAFRTTMMSKNLAPQKLVSQTTRNASYLLHLGFGKCEIAWHVGISLRTVGNTFAEALPFYCHISDSILKAGRSRTPIFPKKADLNKYYE